MSETRGESSSVNEREWLPNCTTLESRRSRFIHLGISRPLCNTTKTKDILHVMKILGHKNINNTLIYAQLVDFKDDEYVSKVATIAKEACQLVEAGFEYVCDVDGKHIFRKRK